MYPLNILQVISSTATSGAERHVIDLSLALKRKGHHVELICPCEGWLSHEASSTGLTVHISPMRGAGWLKSARLIKQLTTVAKFDVVHAHLTRAAYISHAASLITKVPLVTSVHIANNDAIYNRLARGSNRLIAVSGYVGGMLHGRGVPDKYIDIVYNGTNFLDFPVENGHTVKEELNIPHDRQVIGIVGRLSPSKGQHHLIKALGRVRKKFQNAHVLAVGEFESGYENDLRGLVRRQGLEEFVTLAGLRNDVHRLLDACSFTVMPSELETFGLAAIESMARSRPVVASRVGALPEVVKHGQSGLLANPNEPEFDEAIEYLLHEDRIRMEMGECGRKIVEEVFANPVMTRQIEGTYAKAIGLDLVAQEKPCASGSGLR